jgi:cation diffusion facilitator CzcD-associated flavoprotein CzcO
MSVAVIGAGSSGLAVLNALREHDLAVECFERGSDLRRARRAPGSTLHRWRQAEELASGRRR